MFASIDPSGLYITIENNSEIDIKDLAYIVDHTVYKVKKIKKGNEAKIYIFTANFPKKQDLIFYFESNPNNKFVFLDKIQPTTPTILWIYENYSIISHENDIIIEERNHS